MESVSCHCFNNIIGNKVSYKQAATIIQKYVRRYFAQKFLKVYRATIRKKLNQEKNVHLIFKKLFEAF
jgi:IQ calmodulin-binding motif.